MKTVIHLSRAIVTFALALGLAVIAWHVFDFVHFFATDAAYDMREMRGDGPQPPFWRDFLGYLLIYIPVLVMAFFSAIFGYLSYRSIKCFGADHSGRSSEA